MSDKIRCEICGEIMELSNCGYWSNGDSGINAHIGCFETKIDVFKIKSVSMGSFYYDKEFPPLVDLFDGCESGDGYSITIEKMQDGVYRSLPEFTGF